MIPSLPTTREGIEAEFRRLCELVESGNPLYNRRAAEALNNPGSAKKPA